MANLKVLPRNARSSQPLQAPIRIGKDILGLLSAGMYTEPLSILREYVQNAADSIDLAYEASVLNSKKPGRIDITADAPGRLLRIRDNGLGIESRNVQDVLVAFGLSKKRGTTARGFRGIGRLGGLGFAERLTFRTRFVGDHDVAEISWDCRALRAQLSDHNEHSDLIDVVRSVVTTRDMPDEDAPEHFFEVELQGVVRLQNDRLLNQGILGAYLRQIAPLPFDSDFQFAARINEVVSQFVPRQRIDIRLNGSEPLSRPHRNALVVSGSKKDRFKDVEFIRLQGVNGGVAAVGWILNHSYLGALKGSPEIRGLRARLGDMQVGDEQVFAKAFREPRFNDWAVGELHIVDRSIVPNGRRDDFESTASYAHLLNQLSPLGRNLALRCRVASAHRTKLRRFDSYETSVLLAAKRIRSGRITGRRRVAELSEARATIAAMTKLLSATSWSKGEEKLLNKRIHGCRSALGKAKNVQIEDDPLRVFSPGRRALFEEFLNALRASITSRATSEALVERVTRKVIRKYAK